MKKKGLKNGSASAKQNTTMKIFTSLFARKRADADYFFAVFL